MYLTRSLYLFISFTLISSCQPKAPVTESVTKWYKGNLHTHSYWSDGDEFPEMIMRWYKGQGYDFLALSDHNVLAEGEKWKTISDDAIYQNAFNDYRSEYGNDWVKHRKVSDQLQVKLKTLQEYRSLFEEEGKFLIIRSEEITDEFEDRPVHLNATNVQTLIEPQGGNSIAEVMQRNIDAVWAQRAETGVPMIPHVNHPNFGYAIDLEDMLKLERERFFEVYNGHPQVHNQGDSAHISTEEMWDLININYLSENKPLMFGLATDDAHHYHVKGKKWSNAGRGWVMVQTAALNIENIIEALEAGAFYASTGVSLKEVSFYENLLSVEVDEEPNTSYLIEFIGCMKGQKMTEVLGVQHGSIANFQVTDDLLFVRCRITSSKKQGNPIEDFVYEMAWTQPVTGE